MPYTDDATISVFMKIENAMRTRKNEIDPLEIQLDGENEEDCYYMALRKKFIIADNKGNSYGMTDTGRIELARLIEKRDNKEREIARHYREKWHIILLGLTFAVSMGTFGLILYDRWIPLGGQNPAGVVSEIGDDLRPAPPTHDGDEDSNTGKADSDADTDVHEN